MPHRRIRRARLAEASPYEVVLLLCTLTAGVGVLGGRELPGSVLETLPEWLGFFWAGGMVVGSALALSGLVMRSAYRGLLTEAVGCLLHGGVCAVYVVCLVVAAQDLGSIVAVLLIAGVSLASFGRWRQSRGEAAHLLATVVPLLRDRADQDDEDRNDMAR